MPIKNKFLTVKKDWALKQLETWMAYVDAHPFDKMEDRTKLRPTKNGGTILEVVATIEQQQKSVRDIIKDYLELLVVVEKMMTDEGSTGDESAFRDVKETKRMQKTRESSDDTL